MNKANTSDTDAPFLDFHLSISNCIVSSKIYDKHDKFPFLDGDVPCQPSYGVYISQLKIFSRGCSYVEDFMIMINASLLNFSNSVIGIISLEGLFPNYIATTMNQFQIQCLTKILLHQGLLKPESYYDLVYKFKKIIGRTDFSDKFRKIIICHKRIGYDLNVM